jgi:hypothetical protein
MPAPADAGIYLNDKRLKVIINKVCMSSYQLIPSKDG